MTGLFIIKLTIIVKTMKQHEYYVYITTNPNRTVLYIGMTNDIARRLVEHYAHRGKEETFAGRTYCYCLIYLELFQYVNNAIDRETELKAWRREKKDALIAEERLIRSKDPELPTTFFGMSNAARHLHKPGLRRILTHPLVTVAMDVV